MSIAVRWRLRLIGAVVAAVLLLLVFFPLLRYVCRPRAPADDAVAARLGRSQAGQVGAHSDSRVQGYSDGATGSPPEAVPPKIVGWRVVEDLPREIALFETVFWEPRDTTTLRQLLREQPLVRDKAVLEIGTGSGLIALCCLQAGAGRVVATDINPNAVANAAYNADQLGWADRLETRLVPMGRSGAFDVIRPDERFDVIVSNPPWEDAEPASIDEYALYDTRFALLRSILQGLPGHLKPGGKAYLAYGSVSSVRLALQLAPQYGLATRVLDDRDLDQLPEVFLPAMVIEVAPAAVEQR